LIGVRLVDYDETVQRIEYEFVDALYLTQSWRQADGEEKLPLLSRYFREALGFTSIYSAIVVHSYPTFAGTLRTISLQALAFNAESVSLRFV
jgi:hypothetical protein